MQADFVNWDDYGYVINNELIKDLSVDRIIAIFQEPQKEGNYHPLTLISLAIDYKIGGLNPQVFHLHSILLHLVNCLLVFVLSFLLTRSAGAGIFVAAIFALHPMHVESVGWISDRKDLLYSCFFLSSLIFYFLCLSGTGFKSLWYACSLLLFVFALLAKPLAVVLPLVLIALEFALKREITIHSLLARLPFFALALGFLLLGFQMQQEVESVHQIASSNWLEVTATGLRNLGWYQQKFLLPIGLSPFHPFPFDGIDDYPLRFYFAGGLSLILSLPIIYLLRKHRIAQFGYLFFVICILPALQFVPFGKAIVAERYSYLPYFGLALTLILIAKKLLTMLPERSAKPLAIVLFSLFTIAFSILSREQSKIWTNGKHLWSAVIEQYPDSETGYFGLGQFYHRNGNLDLAMTNYNSALEKNATLTSPLLERARIHERSGRYEEARRDYDEIVLLEPKNKVARLNRAILLQSRFPHLQGSTQQAEEELAQLIQDYPDYDKAYLNLAVLLEQTNRNDHALARYAECIQICQSPELAYFYRSKLHFRLGKINQAIADVNEAIALNPENKTYLNSLNRYQSALEIE